MILDGEMTQHRRAFQAAKKEADTLSGGTAAVEDEEKESCLGAL